MVRGIDVHVHIATGDKVRLGRRPMFPTGVDPRWDNPDAIAELYASLELMAVIFDVDNETQSGLRISNQEVAQWVQKYPEVFIGFGSVDPWKGKRAVEEVRRCAELGLRGMKFQQIAQAFRPDDPRFFPIYEACVDQGLAVLFHTGTTAIGVGRPGGMGLRLDYGRPIYVDEVAARYPELRIILAHPAWPWHEEQLAIVRHKGNVYMDLSGWAPKYFPPSVVHYANTLIQDKVFFGSDYPMITPQRWLEEFADLPLKEEVRRKILLLNAARFFGLHLPEIQEAAAEAGKEA
ncbi:MAG: amidohydrolase family protein [Armatimonadota bacterium]|nr:amidohydrolase family protein [Armatimonadota bacterium]MDR7443585.1 amidohydrolase family protein [Armatimonadota bacterium]MDR7615546.1 amidohydrolase family protein [Armatimonadota bacterium]